jgi:hypothetical protein
VVKGVFEDAYNCMKSGQFMRQVVNKINEIDSNNLAERQHFGDIYEQILNDLRNAGNAGEYYTPRAVRAFMVDRIDPHAGEILLDPACGTGGFLTCAINHMRKRYVKKVGDERHMQEGLRAVEKKRLPHMLCGTGNFWIGIREFGFPGSAALDRSSSLRAAVVHDCRVGEPQASGSGFQLPGGRKVQLHVAGPTPRRTAHSSMRPANEPACGARYG